MRRILVCDDSSFIQKMVKRELESSFEVEVFSNGEEAYEFLKNDSNFDFAIIDGEMPGMDGWELIKKIKTELNLEQLPVVMLTASDDDYFKNKAFDYGAFNYLKKPFKQGELYEYLKAFFEEEKNIIGTVLVVEDSKIQNQTMCHQLKEKNIKPLSAYTGEEALRLLLEGSEVDAILLDINLPGASGFEVAKALKSDERFRYIPIIGVTAAEGSEGFSVMKQAFDSGVDDFIRKPYSMIEFYARIRANIHRGQLIKKLKDESERDFLTKLYNRRSIITFLEKFIALSKRNNKPLSFMILDLDKFKRINDTYGHLVGDDVLREVARVIEKSIRSSDIAGRFGGEEFSVILPETELDKACEVAERIRANIESMRVKSENGDVSITVSAGVSEYNNETINEFIGRADKSLYKAKANGRNRVMKSESGEIKDC
ncbi:diguanylate cyclase [Hippea alviniae]|uniref:diguanylate cyclase n=1 Tax=Hippea alviniae TaxID=1279027 RepID=UPI0003B6BB7F|nr:diguanylate cyclase [Hippea alviniae]